MKIARIIPLDEVRALGCYDDMVDLAVMFNHHIIEIDGVWRWMGNSMVMLMVDHLRARDFNLNHLSAYVHKGRFPVIEYMKFNMQIGYSLCGFGEIFGQHEATEFDLPGAKTEPINPETGYAETVIDYVLRVHKGQVLKL